MKAVQVELTNLEVVESRNGLTMLREYALPSNIGYYVALNAKKIRSAVDDYQEYHQELIKKNNPKYDERGEIALDGNAVIFESVSSKRKAEEGIKQLNKAPVALGLYQFPLDLFKDEKIPMGIWEMLTWMIYDNKEEPVESQAS